MTRVFTALLAVAIAACTAPVASPSSAPSLTVFAAASLRAAFEEAATAFREESGVTITLSLDASSALRTQIEQGAPADLFASADVRNATTLVDAGLADGDAVSFAGNLLTIIVPADDPAGIESPADLGRDGVQVIAAGEEVPINQYAEELVANLGSLDGYPPDFAGAYEANVVSREDNVAAIRTKIELGEGDAGIVYVTDAMASGDLVEQVAVPDEANVPAEYAAVVVGASARRDAARAFRDWLNGTEGEAILERYGFTPPPP